MNIVDAKKSLLSCPGDTIKENIDEIGMSQAELAYRLGRSIPKLNELIKGKAPITKDTAVKLEYVLGIPTKFWLNLERKYQDELLEIERLEYNQDCIDWAKAFPILKMKRLRLLPDTNDRSVLIESLLKFFRVASPKQWSEIYYGNSLNFKIDLKYTVEPESISVWLRYGEIQSEKIDIDEFSVKKVRKQLEAIQNLCYEIPHNWLQKLQEICANCGIALVYTPCIAKAPIYGATRWIRNNTLPLIQLTDRQKSYNAFWFSFYHELAHIIYHGKKDSFIEGHELKFSTPEKEKEEEADSFACRMLLKKKEKNELLSHPSFNLKTIDFFSKKFKKHPSILVSQLQRMGLIEFNNSQMNSLKVKVRFDENNLY